MRHKNLRIVPGNDHITFLTEPLNLTHLSAQERREFLHKSEIRETVNKGWVITTKTSASTYTSYTCTHTEKMNGIVYEHWHMLISDES